MMSITNRDLIVRGYDAFDRGDVGTVLEILDPNIHWHVPWRSPLSGDYKGHDEVVGFFTTTQELATGTFSIEINDVLAGEQLGGGAVHRLGAAPRPALVISRSPRLARGERTGRRIP